MNLLKRTYSKELTQHKLTQKNLLNTTYSTQLAQHNLLNTTFATQLAQHNLQNLLNLQHNLLNLQPPYIQLSTTLLKPKDLTQV